MITDSLLECPRILKELPSPIEFGSNQAQWNQLRFDEPRIGNRNLAGLRQVAPRHKHEAYARQHLAANSRALFAGIISGFREPDVVPLGESDNNPGVLETTDFLFKQCGERSH